MGDRRFINTRKFTYLPLQLLLQPEIIIHYPQHPRHHWIQRAKAPTGRKIAELPNTKVPQGLASVQTTDISHILTLPKIRSSTCWKCKPPIIAREDPHDIAVITFAERVGQPKIYIQRGRTIYVKFVWTPKGQRWPAS